MEEKKQKKTILHSRGDFLNLPGHHSDATIFTRVVYIENTDRYDRTSISCQVRDCHDTVSLAISVDDDDNFDNSLHKINLLIRNLKDFRIALRKANRMRIKEEQRIKEENDKQQKLNKATTNLSQ